MAGTSGTRSSDWSRRIRAAPRIARIGKMSKDLDKAVEKIIQLIEAGRDDHVQLSAAETSDR